MRPHLLDRGRAWWAGLTGRGGAEDREPLEDLRQRAATAVVGVDDAVRASQEELDLARAQIGTARAQRFVDALDSARALAAEAFALHRRAGDLQQTADGSEDERTALTRVIDLTRRADRVLEDEAAAFARLRDLRSKVPEMLEELASRADEIAGAVPAAERLLADLRAEHADTDLTSITQALPRATGLVEAARQLVASGRGHLDRGDRAAAVSSARAAEDALGQASDELREVAQAREALATADEDVQQALTSIHADLNDVRRFRADDPATTAAVERATPVIAAATAARRDGGDLLAALAELDVAERDIDEALATYREADADRQRAQVRQERRLRNTEVLVEGVDRRATRLRGGVDARTRGRLAEATRLLEEARAALPRDLDAARALIDRAVTAATSAQEELDDVARSTTPLDGDVNGIEDVTLLDLALGGILALGGDSRGGGWGGSSGGFGGGGRF